MPPARREFRKALDLDPPRTRATTAVNDALRQAARRGGYWLLDYERILIAETPGGIPGWESFSDRCHLRRPLLRDQAHMSVTGSWRISSHGWVI